MHKIIIASTVEPFLRRNNELIERKFLSLDLERLKTKTSGEVSLGIKDQKYKLETSGLRAHGGSGLIFLFTWLSRCEPISIVLSW